MTSDVFWIINWIADHILYLFAIEILKCDNCPNKHTYKKVVFWNLFTWLFGVICGILTDIIDIIKLNEQIQKNEEEI